MNKLRQYLSQHWPAILIVIPFFLLAITYSIITPILEASDELWHYPFVWHLARTGELPIQDPANVQLWRQEGSQPPLYYALAALLTAPIPTDDLPALIYRNPHADIGVVKADGNANMIVHTAQESWPWHGAALAIHIVRVFSVLVGTGTVLTVYALGRALWPQYTPFALLAMSFVAFNPMFLFITGSVNNDNLVTLLVSLILWQLISLVVSNPKNLGETGEKFAEPSIWQFIGLGMLVGLASLAKVSGLGLMGLVGITLLGWGWQHRSWRVVVLGNGIVGLLVIAIAGWWYWRNFTLYGDWTGTQNMVAMMGPRHVTPTAEQLLAEVPGFLRSFWGLFGGLSVPMPSLLYWLLNVLLVAGLAGLLMALLPGRRTKISPRLRQTWPILVAWLILMVIGLVLWTLRTPASQGRLLFPGLAALAILWAAGWIALTLPRLHLLPALALFVLAVWVPWGVITPAYARPAPIAGLPSTAQQLDVTFGDMVHLFGYESPVSTIQPGDALPVTLYWRGEKPIETDYSIFIHLLDENNFIVAQRDIFHGPGVYPTSQWPVGAQFGDTYVLQVPRTTFAPTKAQFKVGLYDHTTNTRLSVSTGGDSISFGAVEIQQSQASNLPNPQALLFEDGIALVGYTLNQRNIMPGGQVTLTLYWQGQDIPSQDYKVFVHLVDDSDVRIAQHDSEPQDGMAATSGWQPGQVVVDKHPLTIYPDAPPGAYRLVVGLYKSDTGQRLRLLSDGGVSVQADSVTLSGIQVIP